MLCENKILDLPRSWHLLHRKFPPLPNPVAALETERKAWSLPAIGRSRAIIGPLPPRSCRKCVSALFLAPPNSASATGYPESTPRHLRHSARTVRPPFTFSMCIHPRTRGIHGSRHRTRAWRAAHPGHGSLARSPRRPCHPLGRLRICRRLRRVLSSGFGVGCSPAGGAAGDGGTNKPRSGPDCDRNRPRVGTAGRHRAEHVERAIWSVRPRLRSLPYIGDGRFPGIGANAGVAALAAHEPACMGARGL